MTYNMNPDRLEELAPVDHGLSVLICDLMHLPSLFDIMKLTVRNLAAPDIEAWQANDLLIHLRATISGK